MKISFGRDIIIPLVVTAGGGFIAMALWDIATKDLTLGGYIHRGAIVLLTLFVATVVCAAAYDFAGFKAPPQQWTDVQFWAALCGIAGFGFQMAAWTWNGVQSLRERSKVEA